MHDEEKDDKRKYRPFRFSGKSFTFDLQHEKVLLDDLRRWACNYFEKEYVITREMYKLLKDIKALSSVESGAAQQSSEFDLLVKILKVFEKDENTLELRIKDVSQKMWYMSVPRLKFHPNVLRQGELVRVRCVELNLTTKRDVIQIKPYTNILRIHPESRIYKDVYKVIQDESETDKLLLDDASEVLMSPVIYTDITNTSYSATKHPTFKLTDLFIGHENLPEELRQRNIFKVRFYCLRIDPQDAREIVQAMCPNCKECFSCKDLGQSGKGKCIACHVETRLVYKMQMLVKDASSQMNKNFYRLLLFSGITDSDEDEASVSGFFAGVPKPVNLYKNEEALQIVEKHIRLMLRYNVWVDALIERKGTYFLLRDTRIKEL